MPSPQSDPGHHLPVDTAELARRIEELESTLRERDDEVIRWRGQALIWWAELRAGSRQLESRDAAELAATQELEALRATISWRITAPIRRVRRVADRLRGR